MKESRASMINDVLSGKVPTSQLEERMQLISEQEEKRLDQIIKPEYIRVNNN